MGSGEVSPLLDLVQSVPYVVGNGFTYEPSTTPSTRIIINPNTIPVGAYSCAAIFQLQIGGSGQRYFAGYVRFPMINVYQATV